MSESPSQPRSKRQKIDKTGRFAALERLKSIKQSGVKHKYELSDKIENVYDTIDEKEYSKRVLNRANEDWIEDDNGEGYVEDGREIFDDDEYEEEEKAKPSKANKKRNRENDKSEVKGKGSIKNMFSNAVLKKKDNQVNLDEDNVLAEILGEIKDTSASGIIPRPKLAVRRRSTSESKPEIPLPKQINLTAEMNGKAEAKPTTSSNDSMNKPLKAVPEKIIEETPIHPKPSTIKTEIETPSKKTAEQDHEQMDYSFLEDDENQFDFGEASKVAEKPKIQVIDEKVNENWEKLLDGKFDLEDEAMTTSPSESVEIGSEMKMWLWDAWEDSIKRPGEVFLFGKIKDGKTFKSTIVHLRNIDHCLYLLPRKFHKGTTNEVSLMDIHEEFNEKIAPKLDLDQFRSRKVTKSFAFSVPNMKVPQSCDYIELRYSGHKAVPENKDQFKTISHIFGTHNTALETFLLDCKIKGPCWLDISNFTVLDRAMSWCQKELACNNIKNITVANERSQNPPPLVILTLNVRVAMNPKTTKNEVIMISGLVHHNFPVDKAAPNPQFTRHFCYFSKPISSQWPFDINQKLTRSATKATKFNSERELLSFFLNEYQKIDPDLIVTHDAEDCQLDIICDRITSLKIPMWSRIGRLRLSNVINRNYFTGRMICDVKKSAEELIKSRSYDLETLCQNVLKLKEGERIDLSHEQLISMFQTSEEILKLISITMLDSTYILRLMCELNVLPLALQITNICGNLMSRTLQGGRSKRNEFLLLHAFKEKDFIVPDRKVQDRNKFENPEAKTKKKAAYSGGLVLEPMKGFYDKYILLMDFNSLYPSIIQEYNICYTTIDPPEENEEIILPDPSTEQGVLPFQIRRLVESRKEVKKLMANPDLDTDLKMQYNIRQLALKLTANSMYGCLGFDQSRFYAPHLAALVTQKGRDILMNTKALVQKLNLEVIYGDTDSIMVNTNCKDFDLVFKIGHDIKQVVNKIYRHVELDIDGVFKYLLLLKKKKYAAVTVSKSKSGELVCNQEHKGLDIVRRDWSQISVMAGRVILDELLSDRQMDEKIENVHSKLEKFQNNIKKGNTPLHLLAITKQLTKQPKEYPNAKALPHVQVAIRMNDTMKRRFKKGDMVDYIICLDGTDNQPMQRAYHIDEVKANENLKVDNDYYLAQQIHPVVSRLCEVIEGTDASRIAQYLGLDSTKFKVHVKRPENLESTLLVQNAVDLYQNCEKFKFKCLSCSTENIVTGPFKVHNGKVVSFLQNCTNTDCTAMPMNFLPSIKNVLTIQVRRFIAKYYENWMVCDETACGHNTRVYTHVTVNKRVICDACGQGHLYPQYTATDLYNQLSYLQHIFDVKQQQTSGKIKLSAEELDSFDYLRETIDAVLARSQYSTIKLKKLFQPYHAVPDIDQLLEQE